MTDEPQGQQPPDPSVVAEPESEALLSRLRELARRLDPIADEATLAARSMFAYRDLDASLAALTFDSLLDAPLVGVRSQAPTARQLSFDAGEFQIELEVIVDGEQRRLVGQCVPGDEVEVEVDRVGGIALDTPATRGPATRITTDGYGRFVIEVEPGTLRLRCRWPVSEDTVDTAWVTI